MPATVSQDEAFQWAGHRLEHRKYRTLPQDACIMDRAWPMNDVTDQVNVYGVVTLSVHMTSQIR